MSIDREKLRELTERIQVGDTDEGADALQEIVETVRAERGDTRQAVRDTLADLQMKAENDAALGKFARKYPKLKDEPVLVEAVSHVLRDELARDLKTAGVTDEELQPIREDLGRLAFVHGKARQVGRDVRSPETLLDAVGGEISRRFNIKPEGVGRSPDQYVRDLRAERGFKSQDESLRDGGSSSRSSSRAPGSGKLTAEQSDRAAAYVEKLRQARGFAPRTPR